MGISRTIVDLLGDSRFTKLRMRISLPPGYMYLYFQGLFIGAK